MNTQTKNIETNSKHDNASVRTYSKIKKNTLEINLLIFEAAVAKHDENKKVFGEEKRG